MRLPNVRAEQLAREVVPTVDPGLSQVVHVQVTPNESLYTVPETAELGWSTLVASPKPFEQILAKFARKLAQVRVRVEQLPIESVETREAVPGTELYSMHRVEIADIEPDDIMAAHVTLSVEKAWLESQGVHKWSIQLSRFDETEGAWVASPSKRQDEDALFVYYTDVVPGFSDIAISGSQGLPEQVFEARDLVITPSPAKAGDEIVISATVTNAGRTKAVYPATLWIDDTVETARSVPIGAGETAVVEFSISRPEGAYKVRIDRLLGDIFVGAAPPPSPTPTMTAVAPLRPSPTATPEPSPTPSPSPAPERPTPTPEPPSPTATPEPIAARLAPTPVPPAAPAPEAEPIVAEPATLKAEPGPSGEAIAAAVVGSLAFVFVLAGAAVFLLYRRGTLPATADRAVARVLGYASRVTRRPPA